MSEYIYNVIPAKKYRKQLKQISKDTSGNYDIDELNKVINMLRSGKPLVPFEIYKDHNLDGKYKKNKERGCHVGGRKSDFCLRYYIDKKRMNLHLLATGNHDMVYGIESADVLNYYLGFND